MLAEIGIIIGLLTICFIGYSIGRIGHVHGGHVSSPHHWIYGLAIFAAGLFGFGSYGLFLSYFGAGVFVSDLRDFFAFRFYGPDEHDSREFWGFD